MKTHQAAGVTIDTLYIDRGYIASPVVQDVLACNGEIICRPWRYQ